MKAAHEAWILPDPLPPCKGGWGDSKDAGATGAWVAGGARSAEPALSMFGQTWGRRALAKAIFWSTKANMKHPPVPNLRKADRVLIVRLSALGDVLHVLPALTALGQLLPRASFSWITEELSAPLLEGHPDLDRVWPLPRKAWQRRLKQPTRAISVVRDAVGFFRKLRRERPAVAMDFQANLRGSVVARLSGASLTVGFHPRDCREGSHLLHTVTVRPTEPGAHRVERNLGIPRHFGFNGHDPGPRLPSFTAQRERARAFLGTGPRPALLFHPGVSAFGAFKAWTEEGFASLADEAVRAFGAQVVVSWGPGEIELVNRIIQRATSARPGALPIRRAPPCSTIADAAGLIAEADLVVAPDTGVLHVADALGTPVVALFGPKDPAVYGPRHAPRRIVRSGAPCSPCTRRECTHRTCMRSITVAMVLEAAGELLGETIHART